MTRSDFRIQHKTEPMLDGVATDAFQNLSTMLTIKSHSLGSRQRGLPWQAENVVDCVGPAELVLRELALPMADPKAGKSFIRMGSKTNILPLEVR